MSDSDNPQPPQLNEEYLDLIIEESAEVIQAITKIKRFGAHDHHHTYYNGLPNWRVLAIEIGDLLACIKLLGIPEDMINTAIGNKLTKLETFGPNGTYLKNKVK